MLMTSLSIFKAAHRLHNWALSLDSKKASSLNGRRGETAFCFVNVCVICSSRGQVAPILIIIRLAPMAAPVPRVRTQGSQRRAQPQPPRRPGSAAGREGRREESGALRLLCEWKSEREEGGGWRDREWMGNEKLCERERVSVCAQWAASETRKVYKLTSTTADRRQLWRVTHKAERDRERVTKKKNQQKRRRTEDTLPAFW